MKGIIKTILKNAVEGTLLLRIRETFDEWIGRFFRMILRWNTKVQPNKVLFHTQEDRYCCNQKYLCEEFRRRNLGDDLDLVFVIPTNGQRGSVPQDVRTVRRGSLEYFQEMFSAKYIFTNSVLYVKKGFRLKKEQILFETWHGSLGIKRFDRHSYKSSWKWVRGAINTGKMTTYCISNSTFEENVYKESYWPNTPSLRFGHPRNDILFEGYSQQQKQIRADFLKRYDLDEDTHFILYGPTFRDSKNFDCYDIDVDGLIDAAQQRFGGKWKVLLRYHMTLRKVYKARDQLKDSNKEHVVDVTDYDDMQELISMADIAITDYSSWIYDFVLQRRPGFIFATDIDLYDNERGFCYPLKSTPFPIATNNAQLKANILAFEDAPYQQKVEAFLQDKGCMEDGRACERTVNTVLAMMKKDGITFNHANNEA